MDEPIRVRGPSDPPAQPLSATMDELRWLGRVKELEWRSEMAHLALAGDTEGLAALLAQEPRGAVGLQRELSKLQGSFPSFGSEPDTTEALAGYLDELERLCEAATPGPWTLDESESGLIGPHCEPIVEACDALFIAAARDALPKLIAEVRRLRGWA